jgi:hypothetical protein
VSEVADAHLDDSIEPRARPWVAPGQAWLLLQRDGQRPLRFRGELLAGADNAVAPDGARTRLALYCCEGSDFVTELRCTAPEAMFSACHAMRFAALNDAVNWFETVAPAMRDGAAAPASAETDALFLAAAHLCRETARENALRHAIGAFLHGLALDQGGD